MQDWRRRSDGARMKPDPFAGGSVRSMGSRCAGNYRRDPPKWMTLAHIQRTARRSFVQVANLSTACLFRSHTHNGEYNKSEGLP